MTAHGEPEDVLALVEVDDPVPGPGEVRVRVHAVAANFPDVLLARGQYQDVTMSTLVAFTTITTTLPSRDEDRPVPVDPAEETGCDSCQ